MECSNAAYGVFPRLEGWNRVSGNAIPCSLWMGCASRIDWSPPLLFDMAISLLNNPIPFLHCYCISRHGASKGGSLTRTTMYYIYESEGKSMSISQAVEYLGICSLFVRPYGLLERVGNYSLRVLESRPLKQFDLTYYERSSTENSLQKIE